MSINRHSYWKGVAEIEHKRFTKNDSGFVCAHCGFHVLPLGRTSRNHCPKCLYSLHVDLLPGDRSCHCGGLMRPVRVEPDAKKGFVITHVCEACGHIGRNKAARREGVAGDKELAAEQYDDWELLVSYTVDGKTL